MIQPFDSALLVALGLLADAQHGAALLGSLGIGHGLLEFLDGRFQQHHFLVGDAQVVVGVVIVALNLLFHALAESREKFVHTLHFFHHVGGIVHLFALAGLQQRVSKHVREIEEGMAEIAILFGFRLEANFPQSLVGPAQAGEQLRVVSIVKKGSLDFFLRFLGAPVIHLEINIR